MQCCSEGCGRAFGAAMGRDVQLEVGSGAEALRSRFDGNRSLKCLGARMACCGGPGISGARQKYLGARRSCEWPRESEMGYRVQQLEVLEGGIDSWQELEDGCWRTPVATSTYSKCQRRRPYVVAPREPCRVGRLLACTETHDSVRRQSIRHTHRPPASHPNHPSTT